MRITGGCHCGAIRYEVQGDLIVHALCHCADCRRHAGAPMVSWAMYAEDAVKVTQGEPKIYASSEHGRRHFCANCGTGLFYINQNMLPGIIDVHWHGAMGSDQIIPQQSWVNFAALSFGGLQPDHHGRAQRKIRRRRNHRANAHLGFRHRERHASRL